MVFANEATAICVDNREYARNEDFFPSRLVVQLDGVLELSALKLELNPNHNCNNPHQLRARSSLESDVHNINWNNNAHVNESNFGKVKRNCSIPSNNSFHYSLGSSFLSRLQPVNPFASSGSSSSSSSSPTSSSSNKANESSSNRPSSLFFDSSPYDKSKRSTPLTRCRDESSFRGKSSGVPTGVPERGCAPLMQILSYGKRSPTIRMPLCQQFDQASVLKALKGMREQWDWDGGGDYGVGAGFGSSTCTLLQCAKLAALTLKASPNRRKRIILFVCGPCNDENENEWVEFALSLRKLKISIDFLYLQAERDESPSSLFDTVVQISGKIEDTAPANPPSKAPVLHSSKRKSEESSVKDACESPSVANNVRMLFESSEGYQKYQHVLCRTLSVNRIEYELSSKLYGSEAQLWRKCFSRGTQLCEDAEYNGHELDVVEQKSFTSFAQKKSLPLKDNQTPSSKGFCFERSVQIHALNSHTSDAANISTTHIYDTPLENGTSIEENVDLKADIKAKPKKLIDYLGIPENKLYSMDSPASKVNNITSNGEREERDITKASKDALNDALFGPSSYYDVYKEHKKEEENKTGSISIPDAIVDMNSKRGLDKEDQLDYSDDFELLEDEQDSSSFLEISSQSSSSDKQVFSAGVETTSNTNCQEEKGITDAQYREEDEDYETVLDGEKEKSSVDPNGNSGWKLVVLSTGQVMLVKTLLEFEAGKMHFGASGKVLHADKRKGLVQLLSTADSRIYITWREVKMNDKNEKVSDAPEDSFVIPAQSDASFELVKCSKGGAKDRIFVLKFNQNEGAKRLFFWMQGHPQNYERIRREHERLQSERSGVASPSIQEKTLAAAMLEDKLLCDQINEHLSVSQVDDEFHHMGRGLNVLMKILNYSSKMRDGHTDSTPANE
eukprot:Nk52_evm11s322 gene=Nk52_evmTU11s322